MTKLLLCALILGDYIFTNRENVSFAIRQLIYKHQTGGSILND